MTLVKEGATLEDLARLVVLPDPSQLEVSVHDLRENIKEIEGRLKLKSSHRKGFLSRRKLLGMEKKAQQILEKEINDLKVELKATKDRLERTLNYKEYPRLSREPLGWRDKRGYPVFAILPTNHHTFTLAARVGEWDYTLKGKSVKPALPNKLAACYKDILDMLYAKAEKIYEEKKDEKGSSYSLKASAVLETGYAGIVPEETKEKIKKAKKVFPDIFFIVEAHEWDEKTTIEIEKKDPLVVGFDPDEDCLFLVDKFDLGTFEDSWVSEFPAY